MGKKISIPWGMVSSVLLVICIFAVCLWGFVSAEETAERESERVLEDSLSRAAVSCYAVEGMYPDTLEYLTENYGVYVDESRYTVHYEIFASNIMPDITVIKNEE
jgi:hypothetical protein